jgi:hypothetical protein
MPVYDFKLVLADCSEMTKDMAEAIVAAGCDDGSPGSSKGRAFIVIHREAESLEVAIRSAIADVQKAGYTAAEVVIEAGAPAIRGLESRSQGRRTTR